MEKGWNHQNNSESGCTDRQSESIRTLLSMGSLWHLQPAVCSVESFFLSYLSTGRCHLIEQGWDGDFHFDSPFMNKSSIALGMADQCFHVKAQMIWVRGKHFEFFVIKGMVWSLLKWCSVKKSSIVSSLWVVTRVTEHSVFTFNLYLSRFADWGRILIYSNDLARGSHRGTNKNIQYMHTYMTLNSQKHTDYIPTRLIKRCTDH